LVAIALTSALSQRASAGGGPENVFLVVNERSWASLMIAHHFAELRQIPPINTLYLDWPYSTDLVDVNVFREKLLLPTISILQQRGIAPQIDYIVYSSDFPWSIDFQRLLGEKKPPSPAAPIGSLTSLTFFAGNIATGEAHFLNRNGNHYTRPQKAGVPSHGFRGWYGFDKDGNLLEGSGDTYLLSAMLGVTSNEGMGPDEVVNYLRRSAAADGTKPTGTIYYCKTGDQYRSGSREPLFAAAVAELKKLDVRAEIINGKLPVGKKDVAGLLTGIRNFDWPGAQSTIVPGAFCENFTSYGAIFSRNLNDGQQLLTDFLRAGAAGSSGTVYEPTVVVEKFPSAFAQVHYARGCTLAEAFYQSLTCPYQTLLVGDPLCRPWANIPTITVEGVEEGDTLKGKVTIQAKGNSAGKPLDRYEVYIEGTQVTRCAADGNLQLDSTKFPDGWCELRVVGIEAGPIETQGRVIFPVRFNNHGREIDFACSAQDTAHWKTPITLTANAPGAAKIVIYEGMRILGTINSDHGEVEVTPEKLGLGPVVFRARAQFSEDPKDAVLARPIKMSIAPTAPLPPRALRNGTKLAEGLQFKAENGPVKLVQQTDDKKWLEDTKVKDNEPFLLKAIFEVPKDGVYQFEVKHLATLGITVDGKSLYEEKQKDPVWNYVPVVLSKGLHLFELKGIGGQPAGLEIRFGGSGVMNLDGKQFRHPAAGK
jgi:hypothetical protein